MCIGDDNLFEVGYRVKSPSIEDMNTISARARMHDAVQMSSYCFIGGVERKRCVPMSMASRGLSDERVLCGWVDIENKETGETTTDACADD
ncbi:hypothetical protein OBBRIDRAFT_866386 [Obba rivulosa]|uniref:Uncharacterized protein n=1 Tax=Obba rivulosa TaxID=1052685 RepID=A0A8E2AGN4_9APHY|nr:hypothetical protein OBBRIDRAFT_866386 [Obba rivulosa]